MYPFRALVVGPAQRDRLAVAGLALSEPPGNAVVNVDRPRAAADAGQRGNARQVGWVFGWLPGFGASGSRMSK